MFRYHCDTCDTSFDEPRIVHTTYEDYYGCFEFSDKHNLNYATCPKCGDENIREGKFFDESEDILSYFCYECHHEWESEHLVNECPHCHSDDIDYDIKN